MDGGYNGYQYGYLVKADKSATKQLDDLCQALAGVIVIAAQAVRKGQSY